jgi:hypothetical protein
MIKFCGILMIVALGAVAISLIVWVGVLMILEPP